MNLDRFGRVSTRPSAKWAAALLDALRFTWSSKPDPGELIGVPVIIDGIPVGGYSQWISDGTYWRNTGQVSLLSNGNPGTSTSGTTETVLASVVVPALALANSGKFIAELLGSYNNSASQKILRLRIGGTGINGPEIWRQDVSTTAKITARCGFQNRNSTGSQIQTSAEFSTGYGATTPAVLTAAVDTTAAFSVYLTGQCANGTEAVTLQRIDMSLN